jgi:hypothetical protein
MFCYNINTNLTVVKVLKQGLISYLSFGILNCYLSTKVATCFMF